MIGALMVPNPNKIYLFAFTDADLPGYVPPPVREAPRLPACPLDGE
jgi:hypothetical protein